MAEYIENDFVRTLLPKRYADSNKATYGKVLNIAGSKFFQGAAILSSLSALKVGAGYVTLACPDCILNNIASYTPDLVFLPLRSFNNESIASDNALFLKDIKDSYSVISLGCGLSTNSSTVEFVDKFLKNINVPIVIDADGLNAIALLELNNLPAKSLITPHPKEISRLLNMNVDDIVNNREWAAKEASKKFGCITLLKGHNTIITDGHIVYVNQTGNSGLAKAGTGDVLTGIITGFAAQNLSLLNAAILGSYVHGACADYAVNDLTEYGILASDLLKYVPKVIKQLIQ